MSTTVKQSRRAAAHPGGEDVDPAYYQHERYLGEPHRSLVLTGYYAAKPLIPRSVQLALRRRYARRQAARKFPAWPIEPILVAAMHARLRAELRAQGGRRLPLVGLWPVGHASACILTHDVEGTRGFAEIERLVEIERRHGFVSCWNFVAEDYAVPPGLFERLRAAGCEIGLHGIRHDGKLFQSRARFEAELPKIHDYLSRWDAVGFRSPATHRRAEWMGELGCLYDSSYPDTDPFEPQPGGCCSILPFMFGEVVELPITLAQDHTVWEILQERSIDIWRDKASWIVANHGLVSINTHPDYFTTAERFAMYDELLAFLAAQHGCWHALPREVATWWKARSPLRCEPRGSTAVIVGGNSDRAAIWWASEQLDEILLEVETA
jgi:peptidoglycan/xylan/chitin deacetylase (PgdA/CDA1 family)